MFKKKRYFFVVLIILILLIPVIMWLLWIIETDRHLNVLILDKTVSNMPATYDEHANPVFILNNKKITKKKDHELYTLLDYKGFFPHENDKFDISDFEQCDSAAMDKYATDNDIFYITDTYGVYSNEWYRHKDINERSNLVYGGLTEQEINLLRAFKRNNKQIIAEYNCIDLPTSESVRAQFEDLFGIHWTGWEGRYFDNLDSNNVDIPRWLIHNYMRQHGYRWPFNKKPGIAFCYIDDHVEILENTLDLVGELPVIHTNEAMADKFDLPRRLTYPYWFEIDKIKNSNQPISLYNIKPTARGDSIMKHWNILETFPAVVMPRDTTFKFYYFAGDFADAVTTMKYSHLRGIQSFKKRFVTKEKGERKFFFWNFYYPLMSKIIEDCFN